MPRDGRQRASSVPRRRCAATRVLDPRRECDDGNTTGGDGCSASCVVEPGYTCPTPASTARRSSAAATASSASTSASSATTATSTPATAARRRCQLGAELRRARHPGQPCVSTVVCGDGKITGSETCDDGNTTRGRRLLGDVPGRDRLELPDAGAALHRAERAATAIVAGNEQCDDGNGANGNGMQHGCSRDLHGSQRGLGVPGQRLPPTTCGDGRQARAGEQCDDGNTDPVRRLLADLHDRADVRGRHVHRGVRRRPQVPAASSATTATRSDGDGCARPARSSRAGPAPRRTSRPPATLDDPDPLPRHASTTARRRPAPGTPDFENLQQRPRDRPRHSDARRRQRAGVEVEQRLERATPSLDRRDELLLVVPRDRLQRRGRRRTRTTSSSTSTAASNPTTLTLDADLDERLPVRQPARSIPLDGLGWNAGANPQTDNDCDGSTAQLLVHERAPLPVHVHGEQRRRRSPSPATTTCGSSSTATSRWTSAASTARLERQRHARRRDRDARSASIDGGHVLDRPVPGRAPHLRLELHADAVAASPTRSARARRSAATASSTGNEVCDDGTNNGAYGSCMPGCMARAPLLRRRDRHRARREQCDDGIEPRDLRRHARRCAARAACGRPTAATARCATASSATRARTTARATATAPRPARSARAAATASSNGRRAVRRRHRTTAHRRRVQRRLHAEVRQRHARSGRAVRQRRREQHRRLRQVQRRTARWARAAATASRTAPSSATTARTTAVRHVQSQLHTRAVLRRRNDQWQRTM